MKTNQSLLVPFGDSVLRIEHLTEMGSLVDLFTVGNTYRGREGLKAIRHDQWLALEGTKNFIERLEAKLERPVLRTKRGKGGGIWAHLYILLDAAAYLSPDLKIEVYDTFVHHKLLEWRDRSGDDFIEMNAMVALTAEETFGKPAHTGHYVTLANSIRSRCGVEQWNQAQPEQHKERARIEESLTMLLRLGMVRDWGHLKELVSQV